jgi:hypothetical protein
MLARMTLSARVTTPLAPFDRRVNAVSDATNRVAPWGWWPARAPRPHEPWRAEDRRAAALRRRHWRRLGF